MAGFVDRPLDGEVQLVGPAPLHWLPGPLPAAELLQAPEQPAMTVRDGRVERALAQELDLGAEIQAGLADQVREPVEGVVRIRLRVDEHDAPEPAADELVGAHVLEVAAVGEIPAPARGAVEPRKKLAKEAGLDRELHLKERGPPDPPRTPPRIDSTVPPVAE